MPEVASTRVKNTGLGQLEYANSSVANSSSTMCDSTSSSSASASASSGTSVESVNGINLGTGFDVFAGSTGVGEVQLSFKTLIAGTGVTMSQNADTITINSTGNGSVIGNGTSIANGFALALGNATAYDGTSWSPGAVALSDSVPVSRAIEQLNELLGLLVPAPPPLFPNGVITITNSSGNTPLLALGVTDNASSGLSPGASVTRVIGGSVSTNMLTNVGPANVGVVQMVINNTVVGSHTMNGVGDNGNYNGLVVSGEGPFPSNQPGFYTAFDVAVSGATVPSGINSIFLNDTAPGAGMTNKIYFVDDTLTSTGNITGGSVAQSALGAPNYSSSVPHYGTGGSLLIGASVSNLAGQTYYGGSDPLALSGTNGIVSSQVFNYAQLGFTTPFSQNTVGSQAITPVILSVNGTNVATSGTIQGVLKNVNGSSAATPITNTVILVKNGTAPSSAVDENSIPVFGLGSLPNSSNATRIALASSSNEPAGVGSPWSSNASLPNTEAAVVAGVLSNNQTNYSTGYLPVGPNLSTGRNNPQFFTVSFERSSVSNFFIDITGTYAGVWIKLPGVSDNAGISPNATNGWWNAGAYYNGAGVPGNASDSSAGCALGTPMTGTSGHYQITFGTESSTNATNNQIIVRICLNAGQSITALSFGNS